MPSVDPRPDGRPLALPTLPGSPLNAALHAVLGEVRRQRCGYMHLRVLARGDPAEGAFFAALVEDRSAAAPQSYVEFLCYLHRQIQQKLS